MSARDEAQRPVLIVSVGGTLGWRNAARQLAAAVERAGAPVATVDSGPGPEVRTLMLTDLVQAVAARRAAKRAIARVKPAAVVYCSITAALLWPAPGAIWLDGVAAENRPGRHGIWQRIVERRRLAAAPLVLTWSASSLRPLEGLAAGRAIVLPPVVEPSGKPAAERDIDVLVYAADPVKRRLDFVLSSWERARRGEETLVVAGVAQEETSWRGRSVPGVRFAGRLAPDEYRALVRRARVFAAAPLREEFGIAQLEALADGAMLVTTPARGAYEALELARQLDARLVSDDLARALRAALDDPLPGYAERAAELVAAFAPGAVATTLGQRVLPRLLPGFQT